MTTPLRGRNVLVAAAAALVSLAAQGALIDVFISPKGTDGNAGTSNAPVRTLERALKVAQEKRSPKDDVRIHFGPGDYGDARLEVDWFPGNGRSLILAGGSREERARFDGGSSSATWLVVRGQRGAQTNVTIRNFEVRNYRSAIAFYGDRFDPVPWSSGNRVEGNLFQNIGQFTRDVKPSFAAVTLSNSQSNVITKNRFVNIRNLQQCDGLHAIYLSGGSSRNEITNNEFDGGCGDTIKARDRSNFNIVRNNMFSNQEGKALLVDSFCDGRKVAECRDKQQECPSWGNQFEGNDVDERSRRSMKDLVRTVGANNVPSCPLPPPGVGRTVVGQ